MTVGSRADMRIPVLYLAPWVDYGGADKGTIDWFRWLDHDRFAPLLVTTQPSDNRRLSEVFPYAEEVWPLTEFLAGQHLPAFIFDLIHTRGVRILHIMNSRIGYDLLPDLASLPRPPAVVVQLHVEEADKSGYVRYVTTRYGNLVDAFSVSSNHLAGVVEGYHIIGEKIRVIPTGVDAEGEFNPRRVRPVEGARTEGSFNILYPGRLTEQKDPLLMVEVIRQVAESHPGVRVDIVGDGPLEQIVRARVCDTGLASHFRFHPPSPELARWYATSDLLLMTSVFEGVPYVLYEAMAMELPVVTPALPGSAELMGDSAGVLVQPRDDVDAYARAVVGLMKDPARRAALGQAGRARVRQAFSVQAMGEHHSSLYDSLLEHLGESEQEAAIPGPPAPLRFVNRPMRGQPLVSVIVPCFNHGRFLPDCLEAIREQDYRELQVIVVDDASTDERTLRVLAEVEQQERVTVIHQEHNSGPSAARNRGVAQAGGRYILPVDADNILLPQAVARLVDQLQSAGERVGYIYPNCQYFGTRDDYFRPPSFNLALLLQGNLCDTCSLLDCELFDAGFRYAEDIGLGHEDWEFVLELAKHGVRGEPAVAMTLLYRKQGFTRSDAVEYASSPFREEVQGRHPELYGHPSSVGRFGRWTGPAAQIKSREAPALSMVMTAAVDIADARGERLLRRLQAQTCSDFELIVECSLAPSSVHFERVRRIPPGLCADAAELCGEGLGMARAGTVLVAGETLAEMLADPGFVEKLLRTFWASPSLQAIAFVDEGHRGRFPYRLLASPDSDASAHALAWRMVAVKGLPASVQVEGDLISESLARVMSAHDVELQWRHAPGDPSPPVPNGRPRWLKLAAPPEQEPHRRAEQARVRELPPALGALRHDAVKRWMHLESWIPPGTDLLTRHREEQGPRRVVTIGRTPPPGFVVEYELGAIQRYAPPGTVRLLQGPEGIRTVPRGSPRGERDEELGHLELAPLPLLLALERAVLEDGSETMVAGERDPLYRRAVALELLGFIESYPTKPVFPPDARRAGHGIVGLLRCVDRSRRRHVYRVGAPDGAELVGELGGLHVTPEPGSISLWVDESGELLTDQDPVYRNAPDMHQLLRWVAAPAGWRGFGRPQGRVRAIARRGMDGARIARTTRLGGVAHGAGMASSGRRPARPPDGHLYPEGGPGRRELFCARHQVTGDQLLTRHRLEAADMGYGPAESLGYVVARAPITGTLEMRRVSVPWASRFGLEVRRH